MALRLRCETTVLAEELHYTWKINNFSFIPKDNLLTSPLLKTNNFQFCLEIMTRSTSYYSPSSRKTEIYISKISNYCCAFIKVEVKDKNGKQLSSLSHFFETNNSSDSYCISSSDDKLKDLVTNNKLIDDTLYLVCEIKIGRLQGPVKSQNNLLNLNETDKSLALNEVKDFSNYFNSNEFSDVKLLVSGKPIFAHKVILSECSPVFKVMLTSNFKEKHENIVKIDDISYELIFEAVRYMYSGKIENLDAIAKKLLVVADRYNIKGLKEICIASMYKVITLNDAREIYDIANIYNIKDLKRKAFELMADSAEGMKVFKGMKDLSDSEEKMLVDIFQKNKKIKFC